MPPPDLCEYRPAFNMILIGCITGDCFVAKTDSPAMTSLNSITLKASLYYFVTAGIFTPAGNPPNPVTTVLIPLARICSSALMSGL